MWHQPPYPLSEQYFSTPYVGYLGGLPPAGEKAHHRIVRPCNEKRTPQSQQIYRPGKSVFSAEEKELTSLWHVQVPSKIRVFLWRLARQTLPSGDLLHHRKMAPSNICAICGAEDSWKHALLDCNMARCLGVFGPWKKKILQSSLELCKNTMHGMVSSSLLVLASG